MVHHSVQFYIQHLGPTHAHARAYSEFDSSKKSSSETTTTGCTPKDINTIIRTLSRRPAGRDAILNLPLVKRAITQSTRQVKKTYRWSRGEELAKLAAKASQAKGCTTKARNKLSRAEARNKGLRTMLAKVVYVTCEHV